MENVRIALAQMEVKPGMPERNVSSMIDMIQEARREGAHLIAFPELCVSGYLIGDTWTSDSACRDFMHFNRDIREESEGIAIAFGNVFMEESNNHQGYHPNKDGRLRKFNAVYIYQDGQTVRRKEETPFLPAGVQPKNLLPNYKIFDDERYFLSLKDTADDFNVPIKDLAQPFLIKVNGGEVQIGFEICEDLWCEDYRLDNQALNVTKLLIENGAEAIVNISASPWTFGKNGARDRRVQFLKSESGESFVPFYYVNCTGMQNNGKNIVTFDGGSTVYSKEGKPVFFSKAPYSEELIVIDNSEVNTSRSLERTEKSRIAQKYESIVSGLERLGNFAGRDSLPPFIIGMSGGIDSALVTSLLSQVVGSDRILGVNMPSRYNSQKTKDVAEHVARKLGIHYAIAPIEEIVSVTEKVINDVNLGKKRDLREQELENVQARIRGASLLAGLSAKYGGIFTSNGNKLEVALGYATLYGDWGGAVAPIGDLTKTEVVAMARFMNEEIFNSEIIPEVLLPDKLWRFSEEQIQPSAELKKKQIDPMKFGYHCALIEMMTDYKKRSQEDIAQLFLERHLHTEIDKYLEDLVEDKEKIGLELMNRWGVDDSKLFIEDLEWFTEKISDAIFKRVQAPPIIITSKSAYGFDIRESILPFRKTRRYEEIRKEILDKGEYKPR